MIFRFLYRYGNANLALRRFARNNATVMKLFREQTKKHPNKPCLIFEGKIWTNSDVSKWINLFIFPRSFYEIRTVMLNKKIISLQVNNYSNRIASIFQKAGFKKGDVVALFMTNKPEFVATWLGLGKLGVITALINTNLRLQQLIHCISVADSKAIIYSKDLSSGKVVLQPHNLDS